MNEGNETTMNFNILKYTSKMIKMDWTFLNVNKFLVF